MRTSLVIGGTSGIGGEISRELISREHNIITLSRAKEGFAGYEHCKCDVGTEYLKSALESLTQLHHQIDSVYCVAGYAKPKPFLELTQEDWDEHLKRNLLYVAKAFQKLHEPLRNSNNPLFVTLGSRWSYQIGCDELTPYIVAKHALITLTKEIAIKNRWLKVKNYCVPPTDTSAFNRVKNGFDELGLNFPTPSLANPKIIGQSIVKHSLQTTDEGIFTIDKKGYIQKLKGGEEK